MNYINIAGHKISQMSLGTVQLGLNYGIANNNGMPDEKQSFDMLSSALSAGINSLDTARAYGVSEDVLGKFLSTVNEIPFITTKVPPKTDGNDAEVEKHIIESVETSLDKLGVNKVNNIMLHNAESLNYKPEIVAKTMGSLITRGYTDMVGVSVYNVEEINKMIKYDVYTATQVPMSIFDQRLINDGTIDMLHMRGFTIFVRSVFLQGLFFLDPERITDPLLLEYAKPKILKLREYAEREGMSLAEIAISFMRDVPGVTSLVLGADTADQVKANASYFDAPAISEKTTNDIKNTFIDVNIPEIMKVLSRPKK